MVLTTCNDPYKVDPVYMLQYGSGRSALLRRTGLLSTRARPMVGVQQQQTLPALELLTKTVGSGVVAWPNIKMSRSGQTGQAPLIRRQEAQCTWRAEVHRGN